MACEWRRCLEADFLLEFGFWGEEFMATYKPGEKAPDSGELIEIGPRGGKVEGGRRTVIERGETIPQLRKRATSISTSAAQKPLINPPFYQSMFVALSISCVIPSIRYSISSIDVIAPSYVPSLAYVRMMGKAAS